MRYTYVGVDSHKDTHTAVFLDCFFDKLGAITFPNRPSHFATFLDDAQQYLQDGTTFMFGLEDTASYGRTLTAFLNKNGQPVKHVNSLLVAKERKNQTVTQKTDNIDAECAARVLLSRFSDLPNAVNHDDYWVLRTLVLRRGTIIKNNRILKSQLHTFLTQHYPAYRSYFENIDCKTSLNFFMKYPSPQTLQGVTVEELTPFLELHSKKVFREPKAQQILSTLEDTAVEMQHIRDMAVQSIIRQMQFNQSEQKEVEQALAQVLDGFGTTLTTMRGIDTVSAAQLLSCIGDVNRFASPAKLAKYAGIAPTTYASGKSDMKFANQRGNRELNSLFYNLSLRVTIAASHKRVLMNTYFHDYYHKKLSEGKTKRQSLKCVQRRLVNIIWNMLKYGTDYDNPDKVISVLEIEPTKKPGS